MLHIKNIDNIIAKIVTGIALTFPVAYIQSISFFKGKQVIATCNWNKDPNKPVFQYFENSWNSIPGNYHAEPQTILVNAIDMDGNLVQLSSPVAVVSYTNE